MVFNGPKDLPVIVVISATETLRFKNFVDQILLQKFLNLKTLINNLCLNKKLVSIV